MQPALMENLQLALRPPPCSLAVGFLRGVGRLRLRRLRRRRRRRRSILLLSSVFRSVSAQ